MVPLSSVLAVHANLQIVQLCGVCACEACDESNESNLDAIRSSVTCSGTSSTQPVAVQFLFAFRVLSQTCSLSGGIECLLMRARHPYPGCITITPQSTLHNDPREPLHSYLPNLTGGDTRRPSFHLGLRAQEHLAGIAGARRSDKIVFGQKVHVTRTLLPSAIPGRFQQFGPLLCHSDPPTRPRL
jgi:hypothetical protein